MKRKWEAKLKQIEERASHYERKPLSSVYRPRLSKPEEPPSIWKLFYRQTQAFNFVKSCKENVHVFALECKVGDGQRIYLVTTYVQLWFYYKSRKNLLHCYEVIPENSVCKLYFDLEFNKRANPRADGKKMVALLIEHVCQALRGLYSVNCSAEDVFNLDSSTEEKFSRHLIFQLHDVAFKDNIHVGNFVRKILQPALKLIASEDDDRTPETTDHGFSHFSEAPVKQGTSVNTASVEKNVRESQTLNSEKPERPGSAEQSSPDLSFLVVKNNRGEKHLFVDLGVYTRNRNFRLYKSSKIGKHVALEVAEDNKFFPVQSKNISEENHFFLSSLVSNVRFSDTLQILTCDTYQNIKKRVEYFNHSSTSVETIEGFQCSPYPEIDQFVLSLVNKNGIKGGIWRWNYFFPEELLVYDICKYRWCKNIGRAHKSNNIMILVDLKNEVWYQKCHDPVCKAENFKSDCFPLPPEVRLLMLFKDEEEFTTEDETVETKSNGTQNPHQLSPIKLPEDVSSSDDWDNGIDDGSFLEATEDAELAEAAEASLLGYSSAADEIPDELILEVLQE
ncbi:DNA-directed primase/polymerase protein isoform X1 [Elephas maximus indicus]|uniref:DNA-directed primase/polymerase protein isoform X1 n=1 Tax=Elephas maximus indicus TaxID=99487 RepID=UPI002116F540|nr:DNA-directed primase/polymerase protein isoform X1 [Elephas maximus indicus]XP_049720825.1 DNA-directed primase/polymerase protein isoform X1 [Elephas maximus indicus]XP_049720826.1 DNA-directed primase/polymerase protein isoform X1 [Elephas maximus indicus]XP_049720827.1 DNA-directed primase/polymerase protein isoform X1 [Elephas maximus indicus]XP_049720828.1 DNA-directed primase/polymerase protein isoform X1 [Elephas maximus indicus]XP_049720829.1 DNA-directed primase/polymerase protein 